MKWFDLMNKISLASLKKNLCFLIINEILSLERLRSFRNSRYYYQRYFILTTLFWIHKSVLRVCTSDRDWYFIFSWFGSLLLVVCIIHLGTYDSIYLYLRPIYLDISFVNNVFLSTIGTGFDELCKGYSQKTTLYLQMYCGKVTFWECLQLNKAGLWSWIILWNPKLIFNHILPTLLYYCKLSE